MDKRTKGLVVVGVLVIIAMIAVIIGIVGRKVINIAGSGNGGSSRSDMTLDELYADLDVNEATPVKGTVTLDTPDLYAELPEIDKYPLAVEGNGDIDIEIFTSGEKAGKDNDSWLIDVANSFNGSGVKTADGKSVSMSVRSVPSGTAADYIISGKYLPDLYTPSNTLFGEYAMSNSGSLELYADRLVGNTAGILVKKDSGYTTAADAIKAVQDNKITMGYTNPQTSATGLNLLLTLLQDGEDNFTKFNSNIPYVVTSRESLHQSLRPYSSLWITARVMICRRSRQRRASMPTMIILRRKNSPVHRSHRDSRHTRRQRITARTSSRCLLRTAAVPWTEIL